MALVHYLHEMNQLMNHYFQGGPQAKLSRIAEYAPPQLRSRFRRFSRAGTPVPTRAVAVASSAEFARLLSRLTHVSSSQARDSVFKRARRFDVAVSNRLPDAYPGPIVGMPGASRLTFGCIAGRGGKSIFHAVNAHPRFHNQILADVYGRRGCGSEMLPERMVSVIEEELALSSILLVPSSLVESQMRAAMPHARIVVQPYGVDFDFWADVQGIPKTSVRRRSRVLFVGQVGFRKGVPFLLDAVSSLGRSVELVLVGPLVVPTMVENLPANVRYLGVQSRDEIRKLMYSSDAFVLPSIEDACALVIGEAAAAGLPVITTPTNGASVLLPSDCIRLVPPADAVGLRTALSGVPLLSLERRHCIASLTRNGFGIRGWWTYSQETIKSLSACLAEAS